LDKLQHIDQLLKRAAQEPANAFVFDSDWDAIEKKLGRRKNRITFMWFFLALISLSLGGSLFYTQHTAQTTIVTNSKNINKITNPDISNHSEINSNQNTPLKSNSSEPLTTTTENNNAVSPTYPIAGRNNPETTLQETANPLTESPRVNVTDNYVSELPIVLIPKTSHKLFDFERSGDLAQTYNGVAWELHKPIQLTALASTAKNNPTTGENNLGKKVPSNVAHWEVGPVFTPSLSGKFTSANKQNPNLLNPLYKSLVAKSEKIAFATSYGINVQFHPVSSFYISSGLFVTQRTEQVDYDYIITNFAQSDGNTGIITHYDNLVPADQHRIKYAGSNSYHFIEIPLNIGFKQPISPIFEWRSQIGLSYLALMQRNGKKGDAISLELIDLANVQLTQQNIATNVKTGLYYNRSRFAIGVEPVFGLNLNSLSDGNSALIKTKPYSYGLNISTNFKLLKK
jgi:hypothetical protein